METTMNLELNLNLKPQPAFNIKGVNVTLDMVDNLYVGKGNCCRCGCGGNYFEPAEHAKKIERSLKKFASGKYDVTVQDGYIFEIVLSERETNLRGDIQTYVHCLYLKQNKLAA